MRAQLLYRTGPGAGSTFGIAEVARIGRDGSNEVPLARDGVSRLHATIRFEGGSFWLEDSGSTNGTFLNGRRVKKERLNHLDVVSLGMNVDLIFLAREGKASEAPLRRGITTARFVAVDGPEMGSTRDIPKGTLTIGRTTACNIVIDSAAVSKMHARVERSGDQVVLTDLGSSNGTFVNGMRISAAPLHDGDRVVFAAVREFRVELEHGSMPGSFVAAGGDAPKTRIEAPSTSGSSKSLWRMRYDFTPGEGNVDDSVPGKMATVNATALTEQPPEARAAAKAAKPAAPPPKPAAPPPAAAKVEPKPEPKAAAPPPVAKPESKAVEAPSPAPKPEPPKPVPAPPSAAPPPPQRSRDVMMPTASQLSPPSAPAAPPPAAAKIEPRSAPPAPAPSAAGAISGAVLAGAKQTYRVGLGVHTVGRTESSTIAIPETKVSRHHATLEVTESSVVLKDVGSANGTYVNGEKLTSSVSLAEGDRVVFGEIPFTVSIVKA